MGVPSYFAWLVRNQANILSDEYPNQVDILYLDLNCAIHPAVKSRPMTYEEMPNVVWAYLLNIVEKVKPQKTLYIAIDGVAPVAKMKQQRDRRYKSVLDKELKQRLERKYGSQDSNSSHESPTSEQVHDFNMISPGTQFMVDLSTHLKLKIEEKHQNDWKFQVILSDASVPGEGEHKIMDHIRQHTTTTDNIIVYGLDSDLIFLTLCNYRPGIALFREKQFFEKETPIEKTATDSKSKSTTDSKSNSQPETVYRYLSIDRLQEALIAILNPYTTLKKLAEERILVPRFHSQENLQKHQIRINELIAKKWYQPQATNKNVGHARRLVLDYICICFLLGNDFLPGLPSLTIRDGGLDQLLIAYKITQAALTDFMVDPNTNFINQYFLERLVLELSQIEEAFLQQQTKGLHTRIASHRAKQPDRKTFESELADLEYLEDKESNQLNLGFDSAWRNLYYKKAFHLDPELLPVSSQENPLISLSKYDLRLTIIESYLIGLQWTWNYYNGQPVSWDWVYAFEHGPLVSDIYRGLKHFDIKSMVFSEVNNPDTPLEQLLQIFPPQSSHLLPVSIAWLMTDVESGLIHMYPTKVELDTSFKRWRWEAHPKLPNINRKLLKRVLAFNLDQEAEKFNRIGTENIFN